MMQGDTPATLRAELDAAKALNIACLLHARDQGYRPPRTSVWDSSVRSHRRQFMRAACRRHVS